MLGLTPVATDAASMCAQCMYMHVCLLVRDSTCGVHIWMMYIQMPDLQLHCSAVASPRNSCGLSRDHALHIAMRFAKR